MFALCTQVLQAKRCCAAAQALLFLEEMTSILLTPFVLWWSLPQCAPAIVAFVRDHTVRIAGVGDVCSLAAFSLPMHGNPKYGSPFKAAKVRMDSPQRSIRKCTKPSM